MKLARKILICLAGGLALNLNATGRADDAVLPGDPYVPVVTRNIFGLNPPTPVDPMADATPPPKITPNGIMSIFGQLQVLFKVASQGRPGKPTGDDDYILSAGQRQDDIEVVKIDEKAGIVTFNNHGETQELPLVAATASSTPAPAAAFSSGTPGIPGSRYSPGFSNPGGGNVYGTFGGRNRGNGNSSVNSGVNSGGNGGNNSGGPGNGPSFGNGPARSSYTGSAASQIPPGMTPETQVLMIEANRLQAQQQGDSESASILPITDMTPPASGSSGN
jgi:hypothetical protein